MIPAMSAFPSPPAARPWLAHYPPGVPPTIDEASSQSLVAMFDDVAARFPSRPAFGNFGVLLDYRQLQAHSWAFAAWLQHDVGLAVGERVALMMPNLLQFPVAMLGALRAGAIVVNVNPLYTPRELQHQLNDAGARAIVIFDAMLPTLAAVVGDTAIERVIVTRVGDLLPTLKRVVYDTIAARRRHQPLPRIDHAVALREVLQAGRTLEFRAVDLTPQSLAFLQYTGGTTGVSKGAMLTHRNMLANAAQNNAWSRAVTRPGEEIAITALPLYHVFALSLNCFSGMMSGGMNYLITNPRDIDTLVREMSRVPFTTFTGVNTLFSALVNSPAFRALDFSYLRMTAGGGAAVLRVVAERWREVTGTPIIEGYGLTEASGVVTANRVDIDEFSGTIGLPLPSTDCEIHDDDGRALPPGTPGEIWVRGPQVMQGYWQRPEETAQTLTPDGWLKTGDIGVMHADGQLEIVDRKKDLILVSGFNVFPTEIEDVLATHPGVVECAVVGVADERSGEAVKAWVVVDDPTLDEATLIAHCRAQLAAYKVPKYVHFATELPKSNIGKILRRELRAEEEQSPATARLTP